MDMPIRWEIHNAGYIDGIYDTFDEAKKVMEDEGYIDLDQTCNTAIYVDGHLIGVDEEVHFFAKGNDLPDDWENMDRVDLLNELYGDGYEPCISPCL